MNLYKQKDPAQKDIKFILDLLSSSKFNEAKKEIDTQIIKFPYSSVLFNILGAIFAGQDQLDKAIENYYKAIEIDKNSSAAHNNLANLFSSLNNSEAEYHYKKTVDLVPDEIYPRLNISNYYIKNSKFADAKNYLNELIEMGLTSKEVYNSLGVAHKGLEDIEMAKKMFNQALDLDSNFDLAQKNLDSL